jgi:hypothetical protein
MDFDRETAIQKFDTITKSRIYHFIWCLKNIEYYLPPELIRYILIYFVEFLLERNDTFKCCTYDNFEHGYYPDGKVDFYDICFNDMKVNRKMYLNPMIIYTPRKKKNRKPKRYPMQDFKLN